MVNFRSQKIVLFLLAIHSPNICGVQWDRLHCATDATQEMPVGTVADIGRFPWLGIVQHTFYIAGKIQHAVTGAVLIHPAFAIASAEDMAKINADQVRNNTKLILWGGRNKKYALDVKDYILHPEYQDKITSNTIALVDLIAWGESQMNDWKAPVLPICLPIKGSGTYENTMYAAKMSDTYGVMEKEIYKMKYVENPACEEFYYKNHLTYSKMNPTNPLCAVSVFSKNLCVWDAGTALITRQSWGFWKLLGFAIRGPGCGAPTRFLNIHDYVPWINDVISVMPYEESETTYKLGLRRVGPYKIVIYKPNEIIPKQRGNCVRGKRGTIMYKDSAELLCNKNFVQGFYFMVISMMAAFHCAIVDMDVHRQSNAAIWVEHNCHRDAMGMHIGFERPSRERMACFMYFKTSAFIEFRFYFSFKANLDISIYGTEEKIRLIPNPFKSTQYTTNWWPTPAHKIVGVLWDRLHCSSDATQEMTEGSVANIGRFPWLGIVQHTFYVAGKVRYAITGAVLIHPAFAIASAEDVAKINPDQIRNNTQLILWGNKEKKYALDVMDYILHPEYQDRITTASIALIDLIAWGEAQMNDWKAPVLPICLPIKGSGTLDKMFAVKMGEDAYGSMQKEVYKMNYVENQACEEFYYKAQLSFEKMNPVNPLCAISEFSKKPCVWDAGTALITRQSWGFWKLLGFAIRGPGCGAPTRFLNIHDYVPWINDVISVMPYEESETTYKLGLRRVGPYKIVIYKPNEIIPKQRGNCVRGKRGTIMYKDSAELLCNKNFVQGFYFMVITMMAAFHCAVVDLDVHRQSNAAIWVEHNCHRDAMGLHSGFDRPSRERMACFMYFKTSAFIELRFYFSFKANLDISIYGTEEKIRLIPNPFKSTQYTTNWWPTPGRIKFSYFAPQNLWWWYL
ncbi:hypothetical protein PYW07_008411 [Mythimna separata]|uniref:Peptidase S1 domain-containing protein n=1 Tax=Mythimna separata TaxID=271217 RepID=A0AAD8DNZ7_MYTSE|nr:hypothetical protein PYW07_008411 [Mythimna separata]